MTHSARILAAGLFIVPLIITAYRILWLGYPALPAVPGETWQISFTAWVKPDQEGVQIEIGLPRSRPGQTIVGEEIISSGLQFDVVRFEPNRIGIWLEPQDRREQFVGYSATILQGSDTPVAEEPPQIKGYPLGVTAKEQVLVERLAAKWAALAPAARLRAIAGTMDGNWGTLQPAQSELQAWLSVHKNHGALTAFLALLRAGRIPARPVEGLRMEGAITSTTLKWVEVWDGEKWENVSLTGKIFRKPPYLLPLARGMPTVRLVAGSVSEPRWIVRRETMNTWMLFFNRSQRSDRWLDRWSLFYLPPDFQETFRILLLVPLGALLVSVLRNIVGFPTFGTFMPVLIALAFRSTGLAYGIAIFLALLLIGYGARRIIDNMRLLLVPRLSLILTAVIGCLTLFALIGSKLDQREFMAVGLLPIVILTMVIERFFVVIEEAGVRDAIETTVGTVAVAVITYGIIRWEPLQLTFFVFPELIWPVAAFQLLVGRYTGFRLSELIRFRALKKT